MKLTVVLLTAVILQVSASAIAQKITLSAKNAQLSQVFMKITQQSNYTFLYTSQMLEEAHLVNIQVKNGSIDDVLQQCFADQPFTFTIQDHLVIISKKELSVIDKIKELITQDKIIRGRVVDENNQPLVGAIVRIKGNIKGIITDKDGKFLLTTSEQQLSNLILQVSYVGYETKEISFDPTIGDQTIQLKRSVSKLDEIQVVAYGETTERFNVGSVSQVTAKDIEEQPVANPLAALEGRVPGMVVTQSSGLPGSSFQVQVRGQNTIHAVPGSVVAPDNPLFIIDGVPIAAQNGNINQLQSISSPGMYTNNPLGGMSVFNNINPADIESIEVLRDADATAIYGSRGANGVVLITTKRGKAGKTQVNGNVWTGEEQVTRTMPMMNTQQYLEARRQAIENDGATPQITQSYLPGYAPDILLFDTTKNTNWKNYLLGQTAHTTDANASISGGNTNTQFLLGTGYHRETYVIPGDFSDNRATFNTNLHHTSDNKKFTLDFSTNYSYDQNNSSGDAFDATSAFTLPPDYPELLNTDGSLNWNYKGLNLGNFGGNPLSYLKESYGIQTTNLISHLQLEYQILPGLAIRSSFGYNTTNVNETSQVPVAAQNPLYSPSSTATFGTNDFKTWIIEPQLEYKRTIAKGKLDILLGGSLQQNNTNSTQINGSNFSDDALLGSISAAGTITASNAYSLYKYEAIFGRINYIWDDQFIVNLTGRRDGSSRFGPGKQFGNFGSAGGGWIFSENKFIKETLPLISYGKIHMSYGTTGSDAIGDYQYTANWAATSGIDYQGKTGYVPQNLYNPDYSWAVNKKLEAGLTVGLLKDRILFDATWFRNRSGNQLVSYYLPIQTGFSSVTQNLPAEVQNTGLEFQINSKNIASKDFSWSTSFNLTVPNNKLIAFPGLATSSYASYYVIGQSTSVIQGYRYLDVNPATGVYQFQSADGTATSTPKYGTAASGGDYQVLGNTDPKFYGGFKNTFSYKAFQLDVFFQYTKQLGYNYLGQIYKTGSPVGGADYNLPVAFLSSWQNPGDQSNIEKLTGSYSSAAYTAATDFARSSGALSDASFIRLKTASLSYAINPNFLKKLNVTTCRVYINAQNLLTITNYKGNDPENQSMYGFPPLKTIVAGVQFTF
jgi:TonB-linked SusC/RagA family outer membrane protein